MRDDELLDALGATLRDEPAPEPSPERIAAVRRAAANRAGSEVIELDEVAPVAEQPGPRRSATRRRLAVAAAAVGVLFGIGVLVAVVADDEPAGGPAGEVEYAGPISGPGLDGELAVVQTGIGRVVSLQTDDLAILPTGEYYEVWFVAPDDRPGSPNRISAGTFHPDPEGRTDVTLAAAVDPAQYPIVEVTSEPGDGDPTASDDVVLQTTIEDP